MAIIQAQQPKLQYLMSNEKSFMTSCKFRLVASIIFFRMQILRYMHEMQEESEPTFSAD